MVVGFTTSDVITFVCSIHARLSDTFDRLVLLRQVHWVPLPVYC